MLSLLYFAQAREVKRLREWAGRAPERDAELQERVAAEAQVRAATPAPRPAAAPQTPAGAAIAPGAVAATAAAAKPAQPGAAPPAASPLAAPATAAAGQKPGVAPVPAAATAAAAAPAAAVAARAGTPAQPGAPRSRAAPAQPGAPAQAGAAQPGAPAQRRLAGTGRAAQPRRCRAAQAAARSPQPPGSRRRAAGLARGRRRGHARAGLSRARRCSRCAATPPARPGRPGRFSRGSSGRGRGAHGRPRRDARRSARPRAGGRRRRHGRGSRHISHAGGGSTRRPGDAGAATSAATPAAGAQAPSPAPPSAATPPPVTTPATAPAAEARPRAAAPAPAAPARAAAAEAAIPSRAARATTPAEPAASSRRSVLAYVLGGAVVVALIAVLVTQVFGGGDEPAPKPNTVGNVTESATGDDGGATTPPLNRSDTTVSVLNGTTVTGLARGAMNRILERGYREGIVVTNTDQTIQKTVIHYTQGNRRQALDVAKIVGVGRSALRADGPERTGARRRRPGRGHHRRRPRPVGARMIYLARHGQTAYNAAGRFQGWLPIGLDDTGRRQAHALAAEAREVAPRTLVSSQIERAVETAAIVGREIGLEPVVDERFAETDAGDWTDRTFAEVQAEDPDGFARFAGARPEVGLSGRRDVRRPARARAARHRGLARPRAVASRARRLPRQHDPARARRSAARSADRRATREREPRRAVTRLSQILFGVLVAASLAAFFVAQELKSQPSLIQDFQLAWPESPRADHRPCELEVLDHGGLRLELLCDEERRQRGGDQDTEHDLREPRHSATRLPFAGRSSLSEPGLHRTSASRIVFP